MDGLLSVLLHIGVGVDDVAKVWNFRVPSETLFDGCS
jgi:hypothetical protein